ncbi:nucleotide disphospho-sugar-binding domain-containing protein [Amycolatopsis palatopharyngis]|uniref:nucleotide disphospho-sugar-binding domain-containing protein n=1 Tax=Amycolatopsis palatopharyngis TaxID=187982 RepID=UPI000E25E543|nr:nucleotide disphospho-sugar-binding domain-containing protein [Amycolatopsis palatopharyngis]
MKILFLTGGSPATVFALSPLATAARLSGHDVLVASNEDMSSFVASVGLPTVSVTSGKMLEFMFTDRDGTKLDLPGDPMDRLRFNGRGFGRLAAASLPKLRELVADWQPDLVVGGSLCYAAGLIAREIGAPFVRHTWDLGEPPAIDDGASEELASELAALNLDGVAVPDLWIDICPPSLRAPGLSGRQDMRFIPYNQQRTLEPWMYRRGDRPRVCVTAGSRVSHEAEIEYLTALVESIDPLEADIVIAAPEAVAADLRAAKPRVHVGWFPLDTLLTTCDLIVHHGGGQSCLNALNAGVPQLLIPTIPKMVPPCTRISDYGAGTTLLGEDQAPEHLAKAASEILGTPSFRERAHSVSAEIAAQPTPSAVVAELTDLVRR